MQPSIDTLLMASDKPVKNASGRYDNVDFRKAAGYEYAPIKCSYNRRDVLLFVCKADHPASLNSP